MGALVLDGLFESGQKDWPVPCDLTAPGLALLLKPSDCEAYKVVNLVDLVHLVLLLRGGGLKLWREEGRKTQACRREGER